MPIGKAWIYRLLFVILFVCLFVRLRISPPRIKLEGSNFALRFIGIEGMESPILGNFAPLETQYRTNRPARGPRPRDVNITVEMRRRKRYAREASYGRRMCGWHVKTEDGDEDGRTRISILMSETRRRRSAQIIYSTFSP